MVVPWDSRLLKAACTQQAGKMGGEREAYLYGSSFMGLLKVGREVRENGGSPWDSSSRSISL